MFTPRPCASDAAIKGLKDGSVSVEDIDRDHSDLLELAGNKQLQKEQESEKQFKKQQDKVPLRSREQAIERIKLAEKTGKKDLIAMAEEQLHDTERKIAKQKKDVEWKKDRKEVCHLHHLFAAARSVRKFTTVSCD